MAYNLQSLIQILDQILHPDYEQQYHLVLHPNTKAQLSPLLQKAVFLKTNIEKYPPSTIQRIQGLETQITDAVHKAEDLVESHLVYLFKSQQASMSETSSSVDLLESQEAPFRKAIDGSYHVVDRLKAIISVHSSFEKSKTLKHHGGSLDLISLQQVIDELDSAADKVMNIEDQKPFGNMLSTAASFKPSSNQDNFVVGLDEVSLQLKKERLINGQSKLEVIPIVGMGGIGKTTLARHLYNDSVIRSHFDRRAWVAISQEYDVQQILLVLVGCISKTDRSDLLEMEKHELQEVLHKTLFDRRYFIVLDDFWSTDAWDQIRRFFPNHNNGSRIVLTTRNMEVATYANSPSSIHEMHLLNESQSWEMLCKKVFGDESCPPVLKEIGEKTAGNCRGLPLALQVIGGLLSKAPNNKVFWEHIGNDISSAVAKDDQHFSKILSLSYDHLPHHLRPCFLYLGGFPEDYDIKASTLIRLWVAEGFLQPVEERTLEEAAEEYLKALVDRSLLVVAKRKFNRKVKSYVIHDMLRDLCIQKAFDEKFRYCIKDITYPSDRMRRINVQVYPPHWFNSTEVKSMPFVRSCTFFRGARGGHVFDYLSLQFELLRVLDIAEIQLEWFPMDLWVLVNIRYLVVCVASLAVLHSSICRLRNLQTLSIFSCSLDDFCIPFGIFELPQIRHILLKGYKSQFRVDGCYRDGVVSGNLQTLSDLCASAFRDSNFVKAIPNLRRLVIKYEKVEVVDLSSLHKLESLKCWTSWLDRAFLSGLIVPSSLKKLTLRDFEVASTLMARIGLLQHLEVLKLQGCTLVDEEMKELQVWEPSEEEFPSLRFLQLEQLNIVHWVVASDMHFPRLRHLSIQSRCTFFIKVIIETLYVP